MIVIRDGTLDDAEACSAVWASTQRDLPNAAVPVQPLSVHEAETGRIVVAEESGTIIGFGGTFTRSGVLYLADLFVRPEHQSAGVGRAIAAELLRAHRGPMFTFASPDPRAQHLYRSFGMQAVHPFHYLDADVARVQPPRSNLTLRDATDAEVVELDGAITRRDRSVDIVYASRNGCRWRSAWRDDLAVGIVGITPSWWSPWHPHGARLGPLMSHDAEAIPAIAAAALLELREKQSGFDAVSTYVSAHHRLFALLLEWGFDVVDTDVYMATQPDIFDRRRYVPTVETP